MRGPRGEDLLRKEVGSRTGLRGQTPGFSKPDCCLSGRAGLGNCCFV